MKRCLPFIFLLLVAFCAPAITRYTNPVISDARGNVLAEVTNGVPSWALARPSGYGAVPGYRPVAFGNGVDLMQSSAWRGREVDVTGYYHLGLRDFDPDSGQWLSYDPLWNAGDPNGQSFCGGDPIDHFDSNGKCVENTPPTLYFGTEPVTQTGIQTTTDFANGTSTTTGLPGQSPIMYDPNQVVANSYNVVTQPTGQSQFYVSQDPLPADSGQWTSTPITTYQVEAKQDEQFIAGTATVLASVATGTEEFLPDVLAEDGTQLELNFGQTLPWQNGQSGLVIGRGPALNAPGVLSPGEYTLRGWLDIQPANANLQVNLDYLQNVSNLGLPIRDASPILDTSGFYLNGERSFLQSQGFQYRNGWWIPPTK